MFTTIPLEDHPDLEIELTFAPIDAFIGTVGLIESGLADLTTSLWDAGLYCWDEFTGRGIGICVSQPTALESRYICFSFVNDPIHDLIHLGQLVTKTLTDEIPIFIKSFISEIGHPHEL